MLKNEIICLNNSDIPEVLEIERSCFSNPWSKKSLEESFNDCNSYFIVFKINELLAGYGGMYVAASKEGYIFNVAVRKDFQRMKVATKMMNHFIKYCKALNLDFLSLEVRESNKPAQCLYKKCGFEKVGLRKNFYEKPQENAVIMTYYFK